MSTIDTLSVALSKLQQNYQNVQKSLAQAASSVADLDPEVRAAAEVLINKLQHPQAVTAVIQSVGQAAQLVDVKAEIESLIAVLQIQVGEGDTSKIDAQIAANNEVLKSPLSVAGASCQLSPANQATLDEVSALAAAAGDSGDQGAEVSKSGGDAAA